MSFLTPSTRARRPAPTVRARAREQYAPARMGEVSLATNKGGRPLKTSVDAPIQRRFLLAPIKGGRLPKLQPNAQFT